jgi:hypothetical protein
MIGTKKPASRNLQDIFDKGNRTGPRLSTAANLPLYFSHGTGIGIPRLEEYFV